MEGKANGMEGFLEKDHTQENRKPGKTEHYGYMWLGVKIICLI